MRDVTLNTHLLLFEKRTIAVETKSSLQEVGSIKLSLLILTLLDKILMEKSSIFFKPHLRIPITLMTFISQQTNIPRFKYNNDDMQKK